MSRYVLVRDGGVMALLAVGACGQREPPSVGEQTGDSVPGRTADSDSDRFVGREPLGLEAVQVGVDDRRRTEIDPPVAYPYLHRSWSATSSGSSPR